MRHTVETSAVDLFTLIEEKLSPVNAKRETGSDRLLVLRVAPDQLIASLKLLTEELGLKHLSTITGLDIGDAIELNYQFWHSDRIVDINTSVSKTDPRIETCTPIIPGAVLYEMEVHDMFGVTFEGHPWMDRKLLLPDNYPKDLPPPLLKGTSSEKIRKAVGIEK